MKKTFLIIAIIAVIIIILGGIFLFLQSRNFFGFFGNNENVPVDETFSTREKSIIASGIYNITSENSIVNWSARRPLIQDYINSGTINIKEGIITVADNTATGNFIINMNTIRVGLTSKKPGRESALERHLKTADFFDVEKFPTASFTIKNVIAEPDSAKTFDYTITGDLAIKNATNEISFPAKIYAENGKLRAEGSVEIDRTKWGLTYGSGSFFKNLADNAISDIISFSFSITAEKK